MTSANETSLGVNVNLAVLRGANISLNHKIFSFVISGTSHREKGTLSIFSKNKVFKIFVDRYFTYLSSQKIVFQHQLVRNINPSYDAIECTE